MSKPFEIRDPVYRFIELEKDEIEIVDSRPFQRLRNIKQLGPTYLVYPGANHTRFEHSLGVMHLSSLVFDKMWNKGLSEYIPGDKKEFYQKALRLASLLHDLGHPPFSHAGEEAMPEIKQSKKTNHEHYTVAIILQTEIRGIIEKIGNTMANDGDVDILQLTLNSVAEPKVLNSTLEHLGLSDEERQRLVSRTEESVVIREILTGELGTDRIDYLIRDSLHAGVKYGEFDWWHLTDNLMVMPPEIHEKFHREEREENGLIKPEEPYIGVNTNGLHAAEALIVARYHMFLQIYFHKTRRILDHHYAKLLELAIGNFPDPANVDEYLKYDDIRIVQSFRERAAADTNIDKEFSRLFGRRHFRLYDKTELSGDERIVMEFERDKTEILSLRGISNDSYWIDRILRIEGGKSEYYPGGMEFPVFDRLELTKDPDRGGWTSKSQIQKFSRLAEAKLHINLARLYLDPCSPPALSLLEERFKDKRYPCPEENENKGGNP